MKFNPLPEIVGGKRLVVVDDSIVRGNTTRQIVQMLRDAGAREVHMRISAPPIKHPCHYGIDMSSREEMIAHERTVDEIAAELGADSLAYLSLDGVYEAVRGEREQPLRRLLLGRLPARRHRRRRGQVRLRAVAAPRAGLARARPAGVEGRRHGRRRAARPARRRPARALRGRDAGDGGRPRPRAGRRRGAGRDRPGGPRQVALQRGGLRRRAGAAGRPRRAGRGLRRGRRPGLDGLGPARRRRRGRRAAGRRARARRPAAAHGRRPRRHGPRAARRPRPRPEAVVRRAGRPQRRRLRRAAGDLRGGGGRRSTARDRAPGWRAPAAGRRSPSASRSTTATPTSGSWPPRPRPAGAACASELLRRALRTARDEAGATTTTLEATAMGEGVYRRLGYRDLGRLGMWEHRVPA